MTQFDGKQLAQKVYTADKLNQRFAVLDAITEIIIETYGLENFVSKVKQKYQGQNQDLLENFIRSLISYTNSQDTDLDGGDMGFSLFD